MINEPIWYEQSGGLNLAIETFNKENPAHRDNARDVMRSVIGTVAGAHGALLDKNLLNNNIAALYRGDIQLKFFLAKWDICASKSICLGGSVCWDTYGITSNGCLEKAHYTEDLALLPYKMRELIRAKPKGMKLPEEGLAQALDRLNIEAQLGVGFMFGEVCPSNMAMMRAMQNNGVYFGRSGQSAVLELGWFPIGLMDYFPMSIDVETQEDDENCFVTRWREDESEIAFIVTKGQATATGCPRTDIRPWRKGKLPPEALFRDVMASSLRAIEEEINWREWSKRKQSAPSPIIPVTESNQAICEALYRNCGHDILLPRLSYAEEGFAPPVPDAHIFIIDDKPMIEAFERFGAKPRIFGNKPMLPGMNVIKAAVL